MPGLLLGRGLKSAGAGSITLPLTISVGVICSTLQPCAPKCGQARYLISRNHGERGRQRRALPSQAGIVKGGEEVADTGRLVVGGPHVLLVVSHRALSARCGFIRKIGQRSQIEELVDELDDRAMLGGFMGDGVNHCCRARSRSRECADPDRGRCPGDPRSGSSAGCGRRGRRFHRR